MGRFDHLKEYSPKNDVRPYPLPIKGAKRRLDDGSVVTIDPVLFSRHMGSTNKAWRAAATNAAPKVAGKRKRGSSGSIVKASIPGTVVTGWEGVPGEDGFEVPYSAQACAEFLSAMPEWMYVDYLQWVSDPQNFIDIVVEPDEEDDGEENAIDDAPPTADETEDFAGN